MSCGTHDSPTFREGMREGEITVTQRVFTLSGLYFLEGSGAGLRCMVSQVGVRVLPVEDALN